MEKQAVDAPAAEPNATLAEVMQQPEHPFREWHRVYSVTVREKQPVRQHVGFLYRIFSEEDPQGRTFVLDRRHRNRGFLLPSGRAYLFQVEGGRLAGTEDLGNLGMDNGVKRILQAPGIVEFERVKEASAVPAPPDAPPPPAAQG
jgi:hypothetical protein